MNFNSMIPSSYIREIKILARNLTEWLLLLFAVTFFFFSFGLKEITMVGKHISFPFPADPSFAAQFFNHMATDLIPRGVKLVVTSPLSAFVAQIKVALLLSFIFTVPFLIYKLIQYFSPALFVSEKISVLKVTVPSAT